MGTQMWLRRCREVMRFPSDSWQATQRRRVWEATRRASTRSKPAARRASGKVVEGETSGTDESDDTSDSGDSSDTGESDQPSFVDAADAAEGDDSMSMSEMDTDVDELQLVCHFCNSESQLFPCDSCTKTHCCGTNNETESCCPECQAIAELNWGNGLPAMGPLLEL